MKNRTEEQDAIVRQYAARSFFLDNNSVVNKISRYMRANLGLIGKYSTKTSQDFDYKILKSNDHEPNAYGLSQMKFYLQEYKAFKKGLRHDLKTSYESLDAFVAYLRKECTMNISTNESELANYAIDVTYGGEVSMVEFGWRMFPQGMLYNIMQNSSGIIRFPVQNDDGEITYLWSRYMIKEFSLEEIYDAQ
jgi:hypothetical protein